MLDLLLEMPIVGERHVACDTSATLPQWQLEIWRTNLVHPRGPPKGARQEVAARWMDLTLNDDRLKLKCNRARTA